LSKVIYKYEVYLYVNGVSEKKIVYEILNSESKGKVPAYKDLNSPKNYINRSFHKLIQLIQLVLKKITSFSLIKMSFFYS